MISVRVLACFLAAVNDSGLVTESMTRGAINRGWERRMADDSGLPGAVHHRWQWQELAACRGLMLNMFFPANQKRGPARARREAEATAVCHRCPVIEVCRQHALRVPEPYGIWGGLSAEERATLLRTRRPIAPTRSPAPPTFINGGAPH